MKKVLMTLAVLTCLLSAAVAQADNKQTAMDLVNKAIAMANEKGVEAAFAEIDKADGPFTTPDGLYVFAYNMQGVMVAHIKPGLVGKNLYEKTDADGKYFRKEIVEKAKADGEGWVDYKYRDVKTKKLGDKTTYLKRNGDYIYCCGFTK